jgi:hypothetical protein
LIPFETYVAGEQSAFAVPGSLADGVGVLALPTAGSPATDFFGPSLNIGWRVGNLLLTAQADGGIVPASVPVHARLEHLLSKVSESDLIQVAEWMNARAVALASTRP